ncbi:hypothetical protein Salat_0201200 [Sesamum alatum]|uniref:Uncharacterized protein n=1 Tax=Sesamum alatum TaxID=300844 RepID=A0AAE1YYX6_9LAMI|nr:hypothetical protein Salat_0201200 [Sesamum alatum]
MNIGIGKGKVWSKAIAVVVSPRAGVDSLIANTLVIDMDETDLPNALHHHYTIDRYIGSGNTGRTFPSGNNGRPGYGRSLSRARDRHQRDSHCWEECLMLHRCQGWSRFLSHQLISCFGPVSSILLWTPC